MASEKRLIDANEIIKVAEHAHEQWSLAMVGADDTRKVNEVFRKQHLCKVVKAVAENCPTVDAVEVVRCKDCRWARPKDHREPWETPRELICQCFKHHYIPAPWGARMAVSPDDFCSYGERKDNG